MLGIGRGFAGFKSVLRSGLTLASLVLLLPAACSDDDDDGKPHTGDGIPSGGSGFSGSTGTGGKGGSSGGGTGGIGGEGGEPPGDALAPTVRITSPENLSHPDDGSVLTGAVVEVLCEATQSPADGSEPVADETVMIQMLDADGNPVGMPKQAPKTAVRDEYAAEFVLTELPTGPLSFTCTARDTSPAMLLGSDTIQNFVDHGPTIELVEPEDGSSHPVGRVRFSFSVVPDPLVDDDAGAEIDEVTLSVLDIDIPLDEDSGVYTASVDFSDTVLFPDPPTNVEAKIRASNVRVPAAGINTHDFGFILDSVGPDIVITAPVDEAVVGGEVRLEFTVTDELSAIDESTVSVKINTLDPVFYPVGRWSGGGNNFVYIFNSTIIDGNTAQTTINISASDSAGNRSQGNPHLIYVDNTPPIVDLDPPLIRELNDGPTPDLCSVAFDPVGPRSANDLQTVPQAWMFRAVVWSLGNGVPGQTVFFQAPTKQDSVFMYVLSNPGSTRYLLEDTNDDGVCDDIKDRDVLEKVDLHFIAPTPAAFFGPGSNDPPGSFPKPSSCDYGTEADAPVTRCNGGSDLGRVISHHIDGGPPVIYALGNMHTGEGAACAGVDWELQSVLPQNYEGWICVAARAEDVFSNGQVGNHGVSRPLRLCYDDGVGAPANCPTPAPSCTSDCTLPPRFFEGFLYDPT